MPKPSWFDLLYDEYKARGEAMFAFSRKQVEEAFEGDLAVTWEQFQSEWASIGAGLFVKRAVLAQFVRRMSDDMDAWEAKQPKVTVRYVHTDTWDRPCYEVVEFEAPAPVTRGEILKDVELLPVGEARVLHNHYQGEPDHALDIHVIHTNGVSAV